MEDRRTLIRGGCIVTADSKGTVLHPGDLLIVNDRIAEIAPTIDCENAQVIDARDSIVAPGFVDSHRHVWQTQLRGVAGGWSLFEYTTLMRHAYSASYEPEDAHLGNYAGALEALDAGITTIVDHSHLQRSEAHSDALVEGLKKAGIRGIYCHGIYDNPPLRPREPLDLGALASTPARIRFQRDNAERVRRTHFDGATGLLRFGIAATEWVAFQSTQAVLEELAWIRRLTPERISIHVGMGINEGLRVVPALAERGALGDDLLFVHGAHLTDGDLRLLAEHGGWVASTPETEFQMGMGYPVMERVAETGKEPSLGIDIVSNFAGDMFSQMRIMLQAWRFAEYEREGKLPISERLPATRMLRWATHGGATAAGMGDLVGSLAPGKQADLILVRTDAIHMAPMNDPTHALVLYANVHDVDTVLVAGRPVKRKGRLVDVDWPKLRGELEASRDRILERFRAMPTAELQSAMRPVWEALRGPRADGPAPPTEPAGASRRRAR